MYPQSESFAYSPAPDVNENFQNSNATRNNPSRIVLPKFPGSKLYPVLDDTVNTFNVVAPFVTDDINSYVDFLNPVQQKYVYNNIDQTNQTVPIAQVRKTTKKSTFLPKIKPFEVAQDPNSQIKPRKLIKNKKTNVAMIAGIAGGLLFAVFLFILLIKMH